MTTESIDYKQAFEYLRRDFFQMVVDDFDRFEEIHNINILERKHEIGNIKYLTLVKQKHIQSPIERFDLGWYFTYYFLFKRIIQKNVNYISNLLEFEDLKKIVEINRLEIFNFNVLKINYDVKEFYKFIFERYLMKIFLSTFRYEKVHLNAEIQEQK